MSRLAARLVGGVSRLAARLACGAVRAYQLASARRPPVCRYVPSCSAYALESLNEHGLLRGSWLTVRRLGRCHPWAPLGSDPVSAGRGHSAGHLGARLGETGDA